MKKTVMKKVDIKIKPSIEAQDQTLDKCSKCHKEIRYDKEDGYWDSFEKEEHGMKYYTPSCDNDFKSLHEPVNYTRGERGIYFHNV